MIEVIAADFERLEADTTAAEEQSASEYTELSRDTEVDKTSKNGDIQHKTAKKEEQNQALIAKKGDLSGTQKELDSAMKYFEKLKPQCIETGESYEDKVAARKEEIESLQEALEKRDRVEDVARTYGQHVMLLSKPFDLRFVYA